MEVIWKGLKWSKNGDKGYNYILFQNLVIETELRGERYRDGGMFEWFGHNPPKKPSNPNLRRLKSQKVKSSKAYFPFLKVVQKGEAKSWDKDSTFQQT